MDDQKQVKKTVERVLETLKLNLDNRHYGYKPIGAREKVRMHLESMVTGSIVQMNDDPDSMLVSGTVFYGLDKTPEGQATFRTIDFKFRLDD